MTIAAPNFRVATPSGWMVFMSGTGVNKIARMSGRTFVTVFQRVLRNSAELANPTRTFDGTNVRGFDVHDDGNWGPTTYRAFWALMSAKGTDRVILDAISTAARAHTINRAVMMVAADLALRSLGHSPAFAVKIPSDALLPRYGVTLPGTPESVFSVSDATAEEVARSTTSAPAPVTPPPAPSTPPVTPTNPTPATPSTPDMTFTVDEANQPQNLPTGTTQTVRTGSGLSWGPIAVVGVAIAVVAAISLSLKKSPGSSRQPRSRVARRPSRALRRAHA